MASDVAGEAGRVVSAERTAYDHEHQQPIAGYVAVLGGYAVFGALLTTLVATSSRLPRRVPVRDVLLGGLAVHKAGRLLAKDAVTSPLRVPFARFSGPSGSSEVAEEVRGTGVRHAVGELVTCPFCLAPWFAGAYVAGLLAAPRATRALAAVFGVVGVSDMLQQVYGQLRGS